MATLRIETRDYSRRASQLLEAWLKGMQQGGHEVTPDDIRMVYANALHQAAREEWERGTHKA